MILSASKVLQSIRLSSKRVFSAILFLALMSNAFADEATQELSKPSPALDALQKSTLLMRVSGWVDWPANNGQAKQELKICLLGKFPNDKEFTKINGVVADKRKLLVRSVANLEESKTNCDIIYISNSEVAQKKQIIDAFADKPVLTVADIEDYAKAGGSMNFTHINGKLGVTINLESMGKVNLLLSPNAYRRITIVPEDSELKS